MKRKGTYWLTDYERGVFSDRAFKDGKSDHVAYGTHTGYQCSATVRDADGRIWVCTKHEGHEPYHAAGYGNDDGRVLVGAVWEDGVTPKSTDDFFASLGL